jgi:hypothetical protein
LSAVKISKQKIIELLDEKEKSGNDVCLWKWKVNFLRMLPYFMEY